MSDISEYGLPPFIVEPPEPEREPKPAKMGQRRVVIAYDHGPSGRIEEVRMVINNPPTVQAGRILTEVLPVLLENFLSKNADYASSGDFNTSELLGSRGQFAELWRKIGKLKGPMWDGKDLNHEQVDEILEDFCGHVLLALLFIKDGNK